MSRYPWLKGGRLLRECREKLGWTQTILADEIHSETGLIYRKETISRWETGARRPLADVVLSLEYIFRVARGTLLDVYYSQEGDGDQEISLQAKLTDLVETIETPTFSIDGQEGHLESFAEWLHTKFNLSRHSADQTAVSWGTPPWRFWVGDVLQPVPVEPIAIGYVYKALQELRLSGAPTRFPYVVELVSYYGIPNPKDAVLQFMLLDEPHYKEVLDVSRNRIFIPKNARQLIENVEIYDDVVDTVESCIAELPEGSARRELWRFDLIQMENIWEERFMNGSSRMWGRFNNTSMNIRLMGDRISDAIYNIFGSNDQLLVSLADVIVPMFESRYRDSS